MKRLYNLYCLCPFCTLYPWKIQAQEGISRRALEELAEPESLQQSALFFNITEAQFPKIPEEHEPVTVEYGYVNRSDKPLTINKVTASCGCIAVNYDKLPIPAGGKGTIKVSFKPKGYSGPIYRQVLVYTSLSADRPTVRLTLTGEVIASTDAWRGYPHKLGALRTRQRTVSFGVTDRSAKLAEVIACGNSGKVPLSLSAAGLPPYLTFRTSHPVIEAGKEADLIFLFDGSKLPVEEKGTITLPVVLTGLEGAPEQRTITLVIKLD